ncbi:hypothetical protein [Sphaerobacter thermophilus]|uniref:Uncharacterized protein n=1 Tax=Sphaerobacter thermophilus (strain ATCC 49802 / DSM 20745 / KCCM 41009 / NCIMB 13125 / S 6022) TaxID=479434 RepID=D1C7K8_SPHTD|nr:hypothetical protein [Sphaerobacter thermophilus]ACZ37841.1 hypothetical protein Sthe_0402 [Sphaerobacter thermophilus DSM 20745]
MIPLDPWIAHRLAGDRQAEQIQRAEQERTLGVATTGREPTRSARRFIGGLLIQAGVWIAGRPLNPEVAAGRDRVLPAKT